jgi:hypothetical protein
MKILGIHDAQDTSACLLAAEVLRKSGLNNLAAAGVLLGKPAVAAG